MITSPLGDRMKNCDIIGGCDSVIQRPVAHEAVRVKPAGPVRSSVHTPEIVLLLVGDMQGGGYKTGSPPMDVGYAAHAELTLRSVVWEQLGSGGWLTIALSTGSLFTSGSQHHRIFGFMHQVS